MFIYIRGMYICIHIYILYAYGRYAYMHTYIHQNIWFIYMNILIYGYGHLTRRVLELGTFESSNELIIENYPKMSPM